MQTRSLSVNYKSIAYTILLLCIAVAAPLCRQQIVTGIIVNAVLFISASLIGTSGALILGLLPSSIALATGLLNPAMAPMIPFIIIGNTILVIVYSYLSRVNFWLGAVTACVVKTAFLFAVSSIVIGLLTNQQLASIVAEMMGWMQLLTAMGGVVLAYGVIRLASWRRNL